MKWASAIADDPDLTAALEQCTKTILNELGAAAPVSLVVVFVSAEHARLPVDVPRILRSNFPEATVIGCSAQGVIGDGLEIEDRPAVAVTAAHLPGVRATTFHVTSDIMPTPDDSPDAWVRLVGLQDDECPQFLVLMDPFFRSGDELLSGLDFAFPAAAKVGGLASGGQVPGSHAMYLVEDTFYEGAVGVALTGQIVMDTVVAQGCRPIGEPRRITKCHRNLLIELDGSPPITYLMEMYQDLPPRDQILLDGNLFLGIAIDPFLTQDASTPGDFLIRNLIGADQERGVVAVGQHLREGQVVQFHVRDAVTSAEDLQIQLSRYVDIAGKHSPQGVLLFQCNGRGINLYGKSSHDSELFRENVGRVPMGGFFCNGEIGPVGGTTYLHGYTSSFAIFRKP